MGDYKKGDKAYQIVQTKINEEKGIMFEVEWQPREDGTWPMNNYYN
jgi:hypothetical protein